LGGAWSQQAKLVGTGAVGTANQGLSVSLSGNGNTAIVGGPGDNSETGAAWVYAKPVFAGTPGKANCHGTSVSALAREFGGLNNAAAALGFSSVGVLQEAILAFCGG
jgi:FG-GAP repeat